MRILVTGSSGLVGSGLVPFLTAHSHEVIRLVRRLPKPGGREVAWDPDGGKLDAAALEGCDAVVHFAGESIAAGRWTAVQKKRILESRVIGTRLLARTLTSLERPPAVMISASAVGYYGDRGAEVLAEESRPGSGFLADVCQQWEAAASLPAGSRTRLVVLRIGMILSAAGGALSRMLLPFRLGVGGRLGSGKQYLSWIVLDDLMETILFALYDPTLSGPINAVAPNPVTNSQFTHTLGRVLRRPTLLPMPAIAIRLLFGAMGEQLLLASSRVEPLRLKTAGFRFQCPELEAALRHAIFPPPAKT